MEIKKFKPTSHKIKALIYWASWSWKTTFWSTANNVIYASAEAWLLSVGNKEIDYAEIKSLKDLRDLLLYLKNQKHNYETVVIDSISEINDIIKAELESTRWRALQLQDWAVVAKQIEWILREFRWLDMHVLFIAQEQEINDEGRISKIVPSLNWKSATKIAYFMDIVWHMEVLWTWEHVIETLSNPKLLSKYRTGLIWNTTWADFQVWVSKLAEIEIWEEKQVLEYNGLWDEQTKNFQKIYNKLRKVKTLNTLKSGFLEFQKEMKTNKDFVSESQKADILQLKEDMKKSLESK